MTEKDRSKAVQSGLLMILDIYRQVSVSVFSKIAKKPDWTGLSNTTLKGDEKEKWIEAMSEELQQLVKVNTFTVVKAPRDANVIDGKWVLR